jgi:hypothetical protein
LLLFIFLLGCGTAFANSGEISSVGDNQTRDSLSKLSGTERHVLLAGDSSISSGAHDAALPAFSSSSVGHMTVGADKPAEMLALKAVPDPVLVLEPPRKHFKLKGALVQSFEFLVLQHAFRAGNDPSLRYSLAHSPFFHNWFASYGGYNLKRWSDGDNFLVNGIGHPFQGAIASRIFIQNTSQGGALQIGKNPKYWTNRIKGMAWAAAFEVQWKVGPMSETSLGNAGGWLYVPDCGFSPKCINNPQYPTHPTNNTGLSDWILTPMVGTGWVMLEDTLDKYVVSKVAQNHRLLGGMVLRTALEPSRSFAGLFMGKFPWQWPAPESMVVKTTTEQTISSETEAAWKQNRRGIGFHYSTVSLPGVKSDCVGCRSNYSALGVRYGYRILSSLFFDSELNFFPGGSRDSGPTLEGLFGAKFGHQGKTWGLFGKVRPGFIYYEKAWPGGNAKDFDNLSRFALDAGGVMELYPSRRSTVRFDIGTTLVRYLRDYPNPRLSQLGSLQSTDYYVNQGNFQISTGYTIRF